MNRNFINRMLTNNYRYMPSHPNFRRVFLLNGMIIMFLLLMLVAGTINAVFGDFHFVYITELVSVITSLGIFIYFRHSDNLRVTSLLFIVNVFVVSGIYYYFAGNMGYSFYWLSVLPFLFYFVVERKYAIIVTVVFFLVFGVIMIVKPNDNINIDYLAVSNIVMASIIVVLLLIQFDLSGVHVSKELAKQNEKLKELSETDPLTGMYNRFKINNIIEENIKKCENSDSTFSIIMSDMDDFKGINDKYGHLVGDRVLIATSEIFKGYTKDGCISGRWGGEEFIFVCCGKRKQEAILIAEQLNKKVSSYQILDGKMTSMSFGIATYEKGDDFESLVHRADVALYKAKASGRGRVMSVQDLE